MANETERSGATRRTAATALIGAYLLFSPILPQWFDTGKPWIRQWTMFGGVGVGLLKGEFRFITHDGVSRQLSVLDVHGLTRYPVTAQFYRYDGLIFKDEDFNRLAANFCEANPEMRGELTFTGRLGHGRTWRAADYRVTCGDEAQ